MKKNILNYDLDSLREEISQAGFPSFHANQIINWIHKKQCIDFDSMTNIGKNLNEWLKTHFEIALFDVTKRHDSSDGTIKWVFKTIKGNIESVYIPHEGRGTLCVSSQVGCALACQFCATGAQGLIRNLSCSEIIAQLWIAINALRTTDQPRPISNVVFMGMGEPLMNEKHVFKAINLMLEDHAYGFSKYRVTVSTVGIVPAMYRLYESTGASIAVSLHAPNQKIRDKIVPINQKYPLDDLMKACHDYVDRSKRSITFEYTMIKGVNDSIECAKQLVKLLSKMNCKINLIPCNPIDGGIYSSSSMKQINDFQMYLKKKGFCVTTRRTRGDDIAAACGQLAQTDMQIGRQIFNHPVEIRSS